MDELLVFSVSAKGKFKLLTSFLHFNGAATAKIGIRCDLKKEA